MEQKPILIQGAMEDEIATLKQNIKKSKERNIYGYTFYEGEIENYPIILSKTRVGLIQVTAATLLGILHFSPCFILNQGLAGGTTKQVHQAEIILGESCLNINSYQTPNKEEKQGSNPFTWNLKTFKEGIDELVVLEANKELVKLAEKVASKQKINYVKGRIGSGDVWNAEKDRLLWLSEKYDVICEDMETVAVYQMARQFQIPVLGIRVLSDNALLEETYDKTVGKKGQEFVLSIIKDWSNNRK